MSCRFFTIVKNVKLAKKRKSGEGMTHPSCHQRCCRFSEVVGGLLCSCAVLPNWCESKRLSAGQEKKLRGHRAACYQGIQICHYILGLTGISKKENEITKLQSFISHPPFDPFHRISFELELRASCLAYRCEPAMF